MSWSNFGVPTLWPGESRHVTPTASMRQLDSARVGLYTGDYSRQKRRLSPNSATVTENGDCHQCGQGFTRDPNWQQSGHQQCRPSAVKRHAVSSCKSPTSWCRSCSNDDVWSDVDHLRPWRRPSHPAVDVSTRRTADDGTDDENCDWRRCKELDWR